MTGIELGTQRITCYHFQAYFGQSLWVFWWSSTNAFLIVFMVLKIRIFHHKMTKSYKSPTHSLSSWFQVHLPWNLKLNSKIKVKAKKLKIGLIKRINCKNRILKHHKFVLNLSLCMYLKQWAIFGRIVDGHFWPRDHVLVLDVKITFISSLKRPNVAPSLKSKYSFRPKWLPKTASDS